VSNDDFDYEVLQPEGKPALSLPVSAQLAVVNNMVLPLLRRAGIGVLVNTSRDGMSLSLAFKEPAEVDVKTADTLGTEDPDNARMLWALRDKVEAYRAKEAAKDA
jgi:hypothetical protein